MFGGSTWQGRIHECSKYVRCPKMFQRSWRNMEHGTYIWNMDTYMEHVYVSEGFNSKKNSTIVLEKFQIVLFLLHAFQNILRVLRQYFLGPS